MLQLLISPVRAAVARAFLVTHGVEGSRYVVILLVVDRVYILRQGFHKPQSLVLLVDALLLVKKSCLVLVTLAIDALAFTLQTLFILTLLVVNVVLEAVVHLEGRIEPILYRVVSSAGHVLRYQ